MSQRPMGCCCENEREGRTSTTLPPASPPRRVGCLEIPVVTDTGMCEGPSERKGQTMCTEPVGSPGILTGCQARASVILSSGTGMPSSIQHVCNIKLFELLVKNVNEQTRVLSPSLLHKPQESELGFLQRGIGQLLNASETVYRAVDLTTTKAAVNEYTVAMTGLESQLKQSIVLKNPELRAATQRLLAHAQTMLDSYSARLQALQQT